MQNDRQNRWFADFAEERAAVVEYMLRHYRWRVGDVPILDKASRTTMWLRRLERGPAPLLEAHYVEQALPNGDVRLLTEWRLLDDVDATAEDVPEPRG